MQTKLIKVVGQNFERTAKNKSGFFLVFQKTNQLAAVRKAAYHQREEGGGGPPGDQKNHAALQTVLHQSCQAVHQEMSQTLFLAQDFNKPLMEIPYETEL